MVQDRGTAVGMALTALAIIYGLIGFVLLAGSLLMSAATGQPVVWDFNAWGERLVEVFVFAILGSGVIAASCSYWLTRLHDRYVVR